MTQFIYFDVGGVVIKDFSGTKKWDELKTGLGIPPEKFGIFNEIFGKHELELCIGQDVESLIPILEHELGRKLPQDSTLLQAFVSRFERNESIWPLIHSLRGKYKLGLLTNMYPNMLQALYDAQLMPDITWDVVIDSSVERVRKPQLEIFQLAQDRSGFSGDEIFFIENSAQHIEAAKKFGWQNFLYDPVNVEQSSKEVEVLLLKAK